jgi:hypothetical protein
VTLYTAFTALYGLNQKHDFLDVVTKIISEDFYNAYINVFPIVKPLNINCVNICIDTIGGNKGHLSYQVELSNASKGSFLFMVSVEALYELICSHWRNASTSLVRKYLMWEHELVHALDHFVNSEFEKMLWVGLKANQFAFLLSWVRYRCEGIAELFPSLNHAVESISQRSSVERMKENIQYLDALDWTLPVTRIELDKAHFGDYYDLGVWMILHVLSVVHNGKYFQDILLIKDALEHKKEIQEDLIYRTVRQAVEVDFYTFVKSLSMPGLFKNGFLEEDMVNTVRNIALRIPKIDLSEENAQLDERHAKLLEFFERLWIV